ncbi:signal transduction histidine kinase [Elusimicrobium posterum]|uniref:sensor histidine kinase n=1 Tax=Elusimicrobium posterum TaxID=3116653 RepID=UPI003C71BECC
MGIVSSTNSPLCFTAKNMVFDSNRKSLTQLLIKAREDEKKRISTALHDEIGTTAVILTSILSVLKEDIKENQNKDALERAEELDRQIKECVEKVKNIVVNMRPPSLDAVGLDGAVKELVESFNKFANVNIVYTYREEDDGIIDDEIKIMLYRIIQESLNNVLKHSGATKAQVKLENLRNIVKIEVSDNGKGFKKEKKKGLAKIGLNSMKESIKYLGGKFEIKSILGKGTRVKVSCPKIAYEVTI